LSEVFYMPTRFSPADVEQLRREAKVLRRSGALTQSQALDQVAQRQGWTNWALLQRNALPAELHDAIQLSVEQYRGGDRGVFVLQISLTDPKLLVELSRSGEFSFELPQVPQRWIVRRFTELRGSAPDPFLDRRWETPRGRFVDGRFICIVSTNGVQPDRVEAEIAVGLDPLCARIRHEALAALAGRQAAQSAALPVRLFFARPQSGGADEICDTPYPTLEDALKAELPPGSRAIGVPTEHGWWTYQPPFGWQAPAR